MHNPIIKIVNADLAYSINKYTNTKKKLLTCNAIKSIGRDILDISCEGQFYSQSFYNLDITSWDNLQDWTKIVNESGELSSP
jgi:hypothetical protein